MYTKKWLEWSRYTLTLKNYITTFGHEGKMVCFKVDYFKRKELNVKKIYIYTTWPYTHTNTDVTDNTKWTSHTRIILPYHKKYSYLQSGYINILNESINLFLDQGVFFFLSHFPYMLIVLSDVFMYTHFRNCPVYFLQVDGSPSLI